jgi:hypothetical protein
MKQELAIIKTVKFGMIDAPFPVLSITIETLNYGARLEISADDMFELVKKHNIYDINNLKGMPCIVVSADKAGGICHFVDLK